jgi:hypothetical protein
MNRVIPIELAFDEGSHGRSYEAGLLLLKWCSVCGGELKPGMYTDGSEGEYGGPSFCIDCLKRIVSQLEAATFPDPVNYECNICLKSFKSPPEEGRFHICSRACWDTLAKWNGEGIDWQTNHPLKDKG